MNQSGNFADKWNSIFSGQKDEVLEEHSAPVERDIPEPKKNSFGKAFRIIGKVIYHMRKIVMAIPVVFYALKLAAYNAQNLPEQVGIDLQSSGEFARMISRDSAVMGPLAITGACLALMLLSRKSVYPWIISIFTLVLPILLLITNNYPA